MEVEDGGTKQTNKTYPSAVGVNPGGVFAIVGRQCARNSGGDGVRRDMSQARPESERLLLASGRGQRMFGDFISRQDDQGRRRHS